MDAHHHGPRPGLAAPELAHNAVVDLAPLGTAAARAVVTPTSDNAPGRARVERQGSTDTPDCAQADAQRKRIATLTARAALVGLVLRLDADGWCLVQPFGTAVPLASLQAAEAIVYGCEQVRAEIGALAARLVRLQGVE